MSQLSGGDCGCQVFIIILMDTLLNRVTIKDISVKIKVVSFYKLFIYDLISSKPLSSMTVVPNLGIRF